MNSDLKQFLLPLLSVSLLIPLQIVLATNPLFSSCSRPNNYTKTDPFSNNLNQLMFVLNSNTPTIGFAISSIGQGVNKVNGLAHCRGDIKSSTCKSCIRTASFQILQLCPLKKSAFIWFDECFLRYSDAEFFGEIDYEHKFCIPNSHNETILPLDAFDTNVMKLMNSLMMKGYLSPLLFATQVMEVGSSGNLYGLAQCSRELSGWDCRSCLESAIGKLPGCYSGKRGGRVVSGSCSVRYELYPFFGSEEV